MNMIICPMHNLMQKKTIVMNKFYIELSTVIHDKKLKLIFIYYIKIFSSIFFIDLIGQVNGPAAHTGKGIDNQFSVT